MKTIKWSWNRLSTAFLAVLAGMVLFHADLAEAAKKKGPYDLKFGLMMVAPDGSAAVFSETLRVEKHIDPSYAHGFTVTRRDRGQFMGYYKVRFPEPLPKITDSMRQHFTITENGRVLESPEKMYRGKYAEHFIFDESDPTGIYVMEVYIDGDLYKRIEYEVAPVDDFELDF